VQLVDARNLMFEEQAFTLGLVGTGDFTSSVLMLTYSSLATPNSWLAHNMANSKRITKKVMPVLGGFKPSNYATERLWATSHDGVQVKPHPMSIWILKIAMPHAQLSSKRHTHEFQLL
jgi:protease II